MDELVEETAGDEGKLNEDWALIETLLPKGWQEKAKELRALFIPKEFKDASTLLRVMLIHLSDGCSLRETAVRASAGNLVSVSDVALLKRLRKCGPWFRWMCEQLNSQLTNVRISNLDIGRKIRLVDASVVCEPGATGSTWRLHYSLDLANLCCDEVHVTDIKQGESFSRYKVHHGDILMADRGLATRKGIRHVISHGGDVVVRMNSTNLPLENSDGSAFDLLEHLRTLSTTQVGHWHAQMRDHEGTIPMRVCALKKSEQQTKITQEKLKKEASKKQCKLRPETLESAAYIVVLTSLVQPSAAAILELYRYRWQIELAFKRLKSLLQLGHLKKTDLEGAKTWLQGKLLVASLIETLIATGNHFSPWGYNLCTD